MAHMIPGYSHKNATPSFQLFLVGAPGQALNGKTLTFIPFQTPDLHPTKPEICSPKLLKIRNLNKPQTLKPRLRLELKTPPREQTLIPNL